MTTNLPTHRQIMTGSMPAAFQNAQMDPAFARSLVNPADLSAGIAAAFPVLSIRGKVFRIKFRGEEYPVVIPNTNHPAPNIDVVILKASQAISKIWYEKQFEENSRESPDCFSTNGVTPDLSSQKKQAQFCVTCPQNQWGSKTLQGKALKACQDTKRVAVVPLGDLKNESFGGPMLLRVPPASLQDLSAYNDLMLQWGHTYFSVGTQLSFGIDEAYPKLAFTPIAPLTGAQAATVLELQEHPQVKRMLSEAAEFAKAESAEQPPQPPGGQPINQGQPAAPSTVGYTPPVVGGVIGTPQGTAGVVQDDLAIPPHLRRPQPAVVPGVGAPPPPPPPPPVPAAPAEPEYQFTPDGQFRWKPGMAAWEPVPPQSPAQPVAVATLAPPANGHALTAEQQEIERLRAQLAQAQVNEAAPKRPRKKATPPPSPAPTAAEATPPASPGGFSVAAPSTTAGQPATAPAAGGVTPQELSARLDQTLSTLLPKS